MGVDIAPQEDVIFSLNPEHEIIEKYLEFGGWKNTGIRMHIGKRAILQVLQYHLNHCVFEANSEHEIVRQYLECGSWTKIGIHQHTGKRTVQKVLRHHMIHCLHIMQEPSNKRPQRVIWKCPVCGKEMILPPKEAKRRKYCSSQCFASVPRKRKPTSEKRKFRMSSEWRRTRKNRISNFGHTCPITLEIESLDVHHIDNDHTNNTPENLIPLSRLKHRLITARANYDPFYEALDRNILLSITEAWKPE